MSLPRVFFLGPIPIHLYGLMLAIGILAGSYVAVRQAREKGIDPDRLMDFVLYLLVAGLVGARLLYIAFDPEPYLRNPVEILMLYRGGLSYHGAVLGGLLIGFWYARKQGWSFWKLADLAAPALALGYAIARVGCDIYGTPTDVPWAVSVGGVLRHPVQLYSSLSSYLIFILLWKMRARTRFDGQLFLIYVVLYSAARAIIEFFRVSQMAFGVISVAQLGSLLAAGAALLLMRYLAAKAQRS